MSTMKTIRITDGCHLIGGIHGTRADAPFQVADTLSDDLVKIGHAEILYKSTNLIHRGFMSLKQLEAERAEKSSPASAGFDVAELRPA